MPDSEGSADEDDDEPAEEDAADGPSDPDEEEDEQEVPASVIANWPMSKVTTSAGYVVHFP